MFGAYKIVITGINQPLDSLIQNAASQKENISVIASSLREAMDKWVKATEDRKFTWTPISLEVSFCGPVLNNSIEALAERIMQKAAEQVQCKSEGVTAAAHTIDSGSLDDKDIEILDLRRQLKEANDLYGEREKEAMMRRAISQIVGENIIESVKFEPDTIEGKPTDGYTIFSATPYSTLTVRVRAPQEEEEE